jgi:enterochelin esterase-like enzyme
VDRTRLPDNKLQYRLLIDDHVDMLGANFAVVFPISQSSTYFSRKPEYIVYPWFYEKTGLIQSVVVNSHYIGGDRNISIYTPPSFKENTLKTYHTFVVFDLSIQFAHFFKTTIEEPIYPYGVAEEYVIVGFGDYHTDTERTDLLTQSVGRFFRCLNGTLGDGCGGCVPANSNVTETLRYLYDICAIMTPIGGRGDQTLDFLQKEVIPKITEVLDNRLRTERLGIIGYSLGGLMACYAAWTRAEVFSSAACQSPSFWWPYNNKTTDEVDFDFINITLKNHQWSFNRPSQRIYIDAGGEEILSPFQLTQMTVQVAQEISAMRNYEMNKNVWIFVEPDKGHDFIVWGKRFAMAIGNLLPAAGDPHMPVEQAAPPVG